MNFKVELSLKSLSKIFVIKIKTNFNYFNLFDRSQKSVNLYKKKIEKLKNEIDFLKDEIKKLNEIINADKKNSKLANE